MRVVPAGESGLVGVELEQQHDDVLRRASAQDLTIPYLLQYRLETCTAIIKMPVN